jgi:hypothetical protein
MSFTPIRDPAMSLIPRTDSLALDSVLSAELADVAGMLGDLSQSTSAVALAHNALPRSRYTYFHLLDLLSQGSTVARSVLAGNSDLLRAFGHCATCVVGFRRVMDVRGWSRTSLFWRLRLPRCCSLRSRCLCVGGSFRRTALLACLPR